METGNRPTLGTLSHHSATLSLVPGPTTVPASILNLYLNDVGSPDLEDSFFELYGKTEERIKSLLKVFGIP